VGTSSTARSHLAVALAAAISVIAIAVAAVVDHRHTRDEISRANIPGWFCKTRGSRCDEPQPGRIHDRWERRELAYKVGVGVFALAFVVPVVRLARRRFAADSDGAS
jgi:hypothetical protein